jgi:flagellar biogenesis protein FliO
LVAVRAAVTRRANRRIIMRQVGDRLIPVGVTSGRVHPITPEETGQNESNDNGGSRRSRRQRNQNQDLNQFLGSMGMGGADLEEVSCERGSPGSNLA